MSLRRLLQMARRDLPLTLGLAAGCGITIWIMVDLLLIGASPLVIPIVIAVGVGGTTIGVWVGRFVQRRFIRGR